MVLKLLAGFGVVLLLTGLAGWIGLHAAGRAGDRAERIVEREVAGSNLLGELGTHAARVREQALLHALADTPAKRSEIEAEIALHDAEVSVALDELELPWADSPVKLAGLERVRAAWQRYTAARDELTLEAGRSGRRDEAQIAAQGRVGELFDEVVAEIAGLMAVNEGAAAARVVEIRDANDRARRWALLAIGGGILLGVAVAFGVARHVAGGIRRVTDAARRIEAGDLGHRVETSARDELGELAASFNATARTLETKARTKALVAGLGEAALERGSLDEILETAARGVAAALGVDYVKVLELSPEGGALLLRAGVGWRDGEVGSATVPASTCSQAGYTLTRGEPVVTEDLGTESRFEPPELLERHGVRSGISVTVSGSDGAPFGVLGAHSRSPRAYSRDEVDLLEEVAEVLGAAVRRQRAEEALRASEASLRLAQAIAHVGGWERRFGPDALAWSDETYRIYGYEPGEVRADMDLVESRVHPEDRGIVTDAVDGARYDGQAYDIEFRVVRPDGSQRVVRERGEHGGAEIVRGTVQDVTERRQLEQQLRQSQKLEAIGRLAGGIAHDFNNILTAITGYAELVLDRVDPGDPLREDCEEIRAAAERAAGLTRQLLAFSRRQMLQPRLTDLGELVGRTVGMLGRLLGEDVEIETHADPALAPVLVDPTQLEQVLLNLAVNARDAMPAGGRLTIEVAGARLDAGYALSHAEVEPGAYVLLTVSDTGVGMDEETKTRIFEPFFTTKETGTGLGLATVYGIVGQSGGHVFVYSEPGRGTTFKIYLPVARGEAAADDPEAPEPSRLTGSETILLVEDDDALRRLACRLLRRSGYTVLEARDAREGERVSREYRAGIDLLVTDVVLPGETGRELAARLAAVRPGLRVLFISGYTENAIAHHGVLDPDVDLLEKPFSPEALLRRVRRSLDEPATGAPGRD